MNSGKREIRIFTSCSPELKKEQLVLWEILDQLKSEWKIKKGITLSYNCAPVQSQNDLPADYDIFLGVAWTRLLPDTFPTGSGTYEDFRIAYNRISTLNPAKILFFIKDYPIPPSKIDGESLHHLQKFLQPIKAKKNLCIYYYDRDDFKRIARQHLCRSLSTLTNNSRIQNEHSKPIRDVSHVLYRIAHNTDTLEEYLIKLVRLLRVYFNASTAKAIFLDNTEIRYVSIFDGNKHVLLKSKEDIGTLSFEEEKLIHGDVICGPRIIGYPLFFSSLLGGLVVKRKLAQEPFKDCHKQLMSFIAEQTALSTMAYSRGKVLVH